MTVIADTITSVEATMLELYARTNRMGTVACTIDSGWDTDNGNVSAIGSPLSTVKASQLVGGNDPDRKTWHLYHDTLAAARRITVNGTTSSDVTAITTVAWPANLAADSGEIREGFQKCPDSKVLLDNPIDRMWQMVILPGPIRGPEFGVKNRGRFTWPFQIQIAYETSGAQRDAAQRASEDAQAVVNLLLTDSNQPAGVNILRAGAPSVVATAPTEEGGQPAWFIQAIPLSASFIEQAVES